MINFMSQQAAAIESLKRDNEERKSRDTNTAQEDNGPILGGSRLMLTQGPMGVPQTNGFAPQPTGYRGF